MAYKISNKDLNNLLSKRGAKAVDLEEPKKKRRTCIDRMNTAKDLLSELKTDDKIYFNKDCSVCLLEFNNVRLISNNDALKLSSRKMSAYKRLWHERVMKLVSKEVLEKWKESKEEKIKIEFLYEVETSNFMDYDGRQAAFKAPLDGIEEAGLIYDDSEKYVPLILGRQKKTATGHPNLKIMLSVEKDPDRFYSDDFRKLL